EHGSGLVEADLIRLIQPGFARRAAVAGIPALAGAGNGGDFAISTDPANDMIAHVTDVEAAIRPERQAVGIIQLRLAGQASVSGITGLAGSCQSGNLPFGDLRRCI